MLVREVSEITAQWIEALVANETPESNYLDYKRELPGRGADNTREMLRDVTSFANAGGGHIVYGVEEAQGLPIAIRGLDGVNLEVECNRLDQIATSQIDPPVPGLKFIAVRELGAGPVVVAHVPRSWAAPHRVADKDAPFYVRSGTRKVAMNTAQLGAAFTHAAELPERARRFHDEQLGRLLANEGPARLPNGAKAVLHLVPMSAFDRSTAADLSVVKQDPPSCLGDEHHVGRCRYNLDGHLTTSPFHDTAGYVQVFRNGILEAAGKVFGWTEEPNARNAQGEAREVVNLVALETSVVRSMVRYAGLLRKLALQPPVTVFLTVFNVLGHWTPPSTFRKWFGYCADRDVLRLPDVQLGDLGAKPEEIMRPVFDALWQAFGLERSLHYDESGAWLPDYRWG